MSASPTAVATIVGTADQLGIDPLTALATSLQESGLSPTAVGDAGTSFGLFQLHKGGELGSLTPAQAFDPATNAGVALGQFASVAKSSPGLSPGALAAAAQRPADPAGYAASVNTTYASLKSTVGEPPAPSSPGFGSWLSKFWSNLTSGGVVKDIGTALNPTGAAATAAAGATASTAASALSTSWGKDALSIGLELLFVLGGLALLVLGAQRMFPGVTRTITTAVASGAKAAPLLAA